jgi:preprotein translocase subunit SecG
MSTFSIFVALIVFVCFLLVLVVMVQNPKGGGLSSSFGGGTQQMGGVQKTSDFLDRSTWLLATLLLALILVSNITLSSGNDTIDSKLLEDPSIPENLENPIDQPIQEIPEANTNQVPIPEMPEPGN